MEKVLLQAVDFYQNYSQAEMIMYRAHLNVLQEFLDKDDLNGALSCLTESPFVNVPEFSFYRINLLIRLNRIDEALEVANDKEFSNFKPIQVQREGILSYLSEQQKEEQKRLEEQAKEEQKRLEEQAKEEQKRLEEQTKKEQTEEEQSDPIISSKNILKNTNSEQINKNVGNEESQTTVASDVSVNEKTIVIVGRQKMNKTIVLLYTKIYAGVATVEELLDAKIDDYRKAILVACYYDKFNRAAGVKYLKKIRQSFKGNERKTLNMLLDRLENKKRKFFDMEYYGILLNTTISSSYFDILMDKLAKQQMLEQEHQQEIISQRQAELRKVREKEALQKKENASRTNSQASTKTLVFKGPASPSTLTNSIFKPQVEEKRIDDPLDVSVNNISSNLQNNEFTTNNVDDINLDVTTKIDNKRKLRIRDVFPNECNTISKYFYALANARKSGGYVMQFDNFEALIDKSVDDIFALSKFETVVLKCAKSINVKVEWDEKKFLELKERK